MEEQKKETVRKPFDVEISNGRIMIHTKDFGEFGEMVWCANVIDFERFKEITESYVFVLEKLKTERGSIV